MTYRGVYGCILAGGQSSRFGSDKALALVDGVPLITHIAQELEAVTERVFVVARNAHAYAHLGLETLGDLCPGRGPLAGIHTALNHLSPGAHALVVSCDLWGLSSEVLTPLRDAPGAPGAPGAPEIVLYDQLPLQPLLGRYSASLLPRVGAAVEEGRLGVRAFARARDLLLLPAPMALHRVVNANYSRDLPEACPVATAGA